MDLDYAIVRVNYLIRDRGGKFPELFDRIGFDAGVLGGLLSEYRPAA